MCHCSRKLSIIPNSITALNLLTGCVGIIFALRGELEIASSLIWLAALFDFLDGLLARSLKAFSDLGKQLDSLSDMVSFGVLPGMILFQLIGTDPLQFLALLIPVASAFRLAKFNIDENQSDSFLGLPTPANAILVSGLPFFELFPLSNVILIILVFALSILMVSRLPLMALKFKGFGLKGNEIRYIFLVSALALLIFFQYQGITLVILLYLLFSIFGAKKSS